MLYEVITEQLKAIYEMVISKGAENHLDSIPESYDEIRKLVKSSKPVPPYSADWYKSYIYANVPLLTAINNKNIYLLGAVDILFTMFYACYEAELEQIIINLDKL